MKKKSARTLYTGWINDDAFVSGSLHQSSFIFDRCGIIAKAASMFVPRKKNKNEREKPNKAKNSKLGDILNSLNVVVPGRLYEMFGL